MLRALSPLVWRLIMKPRVYRWPLIFLAFRRGLCSLLVVSLFSGMFLAPCCMPVGIWYATLLCTIVLSCDISSFHLLNMILLWKVGQYLLVGCFTAWGCKCLVLDQILGPLSGTFPRSEEHFFVPLDFRGTYCSFKHFCPSLFSFWVSNALTCCPLCLYQIVCTSG